jgi:hypothetical protein
VIVQLQSCCSPDHPRTEHTVEAVFTILDLVSPLLGQIM